VSLRARRANKLRQQGFFYFERKELSKLKVRTSPWIKKVRRQREWEFRNMTRIADKENWSSTMFRREWGKYVLDKYREKGWLLADGTPDPWTMFRKLRAEAIKRGEWIETPTPKGTHRRTKPDERGIMRRIDKGDVVKQKERYRERQKR